MVAPGYLAFVSKLAPKEKISAYIGCNFLASFIGIWGGALFFGLISNFVAIELLRPHFFFGIVIATGLLVLFGFMIYYNIWGQDIIERAAEIKAKEENIPIEEARHVAYEPFILKFMDKKRSIIFPILLIPVILIATFSLGSDTFIGIDGEGESTMDITYTETTITISTTDYTSAGETSEVLIPTDEGILKYINVSFEWQDENVQFQRLQDNEADSFQISLLPPNATAVSDAGPSQNGNNGQGSLSLTYEVDEELTAGGEEWTLNVDCTQAGNIVGRFGVRNIANDNGNDWSAVITVTYLQEVTAES